MNVLWTVLLFLFPWPWQGKFYIAIDRFLDLSSLDSCAFLAVVHKFCMHMQGWLVVGQLGGSRN